MTAIRRRPKVVLDPLLWPNGRRLDRSSRPYRLHVMASTVAEAACAAGGMIFDRAMAGWQVTVLVPGKSDGRPIAILGASMVALDEAIGDPICAPDAVVHCSDVPQLNDSATPVAVWTQRNRGCWVAVQKNRPGAAGPAMAHDLSSAARSFKLCALEAAGRAAFCGAGRENFRWTGTRFGLATRQTLTGS